MVLELSDCQWQQGVVDCRAVDTSGIGQFRMLVSSIVMSAKVTPVSASSAAKKATKGLVMLLSPAKTLDQSPLDPSLASSLPSTSVPDCDPQKTKEIVQAMKKRSQKELGKLLGISDSLSATVHKYWSEFKEDESQRDEHDKKPAVFLFNGPAYQMLNPKECSHSALAFLNKHLRIVDPVYGLLRPLDLVQPYRLEMATKKIFEDEKVKLSEFWETSVTERVVNEMAFHPNALLLNLASEEYAEVINKKTLPETIKFVNVRFWHDGRNIGVHAKKARGLLARYIAEKEISDIEDIKAFAEDGYFCVEDKSNDTTVVFDRKNQALNKRKQVAEQTASTPRKTRSKR